MVHTKGSRCDHVALDLVHHEKTHTGEKPFSRSFCDYTVTHKGVVTVVTVHIIKTPTGETKRPLSCLHCAYSAIHWHCRSKKLSKTVRPIMLLSLNK